MFISPSLVSLKCSNVCMYVCNLTFVRALCACAVLDLTRVTFLEQVLLYCDTILVNYCMNKLHLDEVVPAELTILSASLREIISR